MTKYRSPVEALGNLTPSEWPLKKWKYGKLLPGSKACPPSLPHYHFIVVVLRIGKSLFFTI
jgi:hypothetical protein